MTINQFKLQAGVLPPPAAQEVRGKFIQTFVDTESEFYKANISTLHRFKDGLCYTGYLWDCLRKPYTIVNYKKAIENLNGRMEVFAFWDIHSNERILIPDYWKFPKDTVLQVGAVTLAANLKLLPEDLYICDNSFRWALVFTHEENHKARERICVELDRTS